MRQDIFQYLKGYSSDVSKINRLLISTFISINDIKVVNNNLIGNLLINSQDEDWDYLADFLNLFEDKFELENLIELFEFVISPKDKIVNGAVYTPTNIRSFIIKSAFSRTVIKPDLKLADISCGCGGFLADSAIYLRNKTGKSFYDIFENHIYGLDIQEYSIERTKLLLSLVALLSGEDEDFNFNLFVGNALNHEWALYFDIILGNPPYVCSRNVDDDTKKYLQNWSVCATGHPDLYIPFFQIALEQLKENGVLGYITVNSFLKSVNGRALREYITKRRNEFDLIDFGGEQIFHSRSTYTCICLIKNCASQFIRYKKINSSELRFGLNTYTKRKYVDLGVEDGWSFSKIDLIKRIENIGKSFGSQYKTRNGIATLKNNVYVFDPIKEDKNYYYLKDDEKIFQIEKAICRDIINPNKLTTISDIDLIKRKIIFPYRYVKELSQPKVIEEKSFYKSFPKAYNYLFTKKEILARRDKGNGKYEAWYAYGRNQSLEKMGSKLFFPHIAPSTPNFIISKEDLLFYNGLAVVDNNPIKLQVIKILFSSRLFWFYIANTSKPYSSGYFSLSRNYIKNFGIYDFSDADIEYMLSETNKSELDKFIENRYGVVIEG
ncbi:MULTISPECIES: HsdM family class I SAM-dependent methyltransferase [unclassified Carboxylicivirga]|uniref:HsdM family class I SAM-dependent methyltransferase n=1 Tax=Carboxylicivirga TaxID=1628153 RepID=UPI003D325C73